MTPRQTGWTDAEIELYLDNELEAARRQALTADLRHDAALRERLASAGRLDALVERTLASPAARTAAARRTRWLAVGGPVALAVAAGLTLILWMQTPESGAPAWRQPRASNGQIGSNVGSPRRAATPYNAIRVVASVPVRARPAGVDEHNATALPDAEMSPVVAAPQAPDAATGTPLGGTPDLDRLLSDGRVDDALAALAGSPREQKLDGYRRIGDLLRSATVAEQLLDRLAAADQLDVCATWAAEPTLRAIAFKRLQRLAKSPELADGMAAVVKTLSSNAALQSWLVSYRLAEFETR